MSQLFYDGPETALIVWENEGGAVFKSRPRQRVRTLTWAKYAQATLTHRAEKWAKHVQAIRDGDLVPYREAAERVWREAFGSRCIGPLDADEETALAEGESYPDYARIRNRDDSRGTNSMGRNLAS